MGFDHVLAAAPVGGGYVSTLKVIPALVILAVWARLLTWADKDAPAAHLPRITFNLANISGMMVAYALFFLLPTFWLSFGVLLVAAGAESGVYLSIRRKNVGLEDLDKQFKAWLKSFKGKKEVKAVAGTVQVFSKEGKALPVPDEESPDRAAYDAVQKSLTEPLKKGTQQVDIAPEGEGLVVKYVVDNFAYRGAELDRTAGAAAISYLKWAAGLAVEDKRKPQTGMLKVNLDGTKVEMRMQTAGNTAGEYMRLLVDPKKRQDYTLDTLGLTDAQKTLLTDSIKENSGVVLVSAPKGHGLTSLFYGILKAHDAFLQHIQTIERDQEQDLEGITQNKLPPAATGAEELKLVSWVISQEPDILGVSKVEDAKSAAALIAYGKSGKRAYVCMRASSTFEALEQWRKLVGDNRLATESLKMVINGRVLRRLCLACKEAFNPDPAVLRKLNLNPEKVTTLFRARETALRDQKGQPVLCEFCQEMRYKGRTGAFEMLVVDDEIRQAVEAGRPLTQAFRKQRGRYLQEELLALVEKGDTSVQEVQRVLKVGGDAPAAAAPAAPAARPSAPKRPAAT
jgi:type II secretory ATPase GspE/PulE/Tfp pilus assembly ATPase PilB-like protein